MVCSLMFDNKDTPSGNSRGLPTPKRGGTTLQDGDGGRKIIKSQELEDFARDLKGSSEKKKTILLWSKKSANCACHPHSTTHKFLDCKAVLRECTHHRCERELLECKGRSRTPVSSVTTRHVTRQLPQPPTHVSNQSSARVQDSVSDTSSEFHESDYNSSTDNHSCEGSLDYVASPTSVTSNSSVASSLKLPQHTKIPYVQPLHMSRLLPYQQTMT